LNARNSFPEVLQIWPLSEQAFLERDFIIPDVMDELEVISAAIFEPLSVDQITKDKIR